VIDWQAESRSTSESQAYAMLRSVLADDPETFARTLKWAEDNLARHQGKTSGGPLSDRLWSWNWGKQGEQWVILDANFASDADIDAATALILAARRWNKPAYLELAKLKLKDLWQLSTVSQGGQRYLLPGPRAAFDKGDRLQFNPSYLAPYAFRLFASVDPERDWQSLVSSSYRILEASSDLSAKGLPSDWIEMDLQGNFHPISQPSQLSSQYSFDAYRVWWRVALDLIWYDAPEARQYLTQHLGSLRETWQQEQRLFAQYDLDGNPLVDYEATSQYGMLYPAFQKLDPAIAAEMFQFKLLPQYKQGLWDDESAYYSQNLAWLGIFPYDKASAITQ
jgi:endoglucanase